MTDILKKYIREILTEEIVTVSKGTESGTYNAKFDQKGNIVTARKINVSSDVEELIKDAASMTTVPMGVLYKFLTSGVKVRQPAKSPKNVEKVLQDPAWIETLSWPTTNRIGRGELALKLAFEYDESAPEPDFVSADGTTKLSLKYFGPGGTKDVLSSGANEKTPVFAAKLAKTLGLKGFPQSGSWSATQLREVLEKMKPAARKTAIDAARAVLTELKLSLLSEHSAQGILAASDAHGYEFLPARDPSSIQISSIRFSGTRIGFKGPHATGDSFENALDEVELGGGESAAAEEAPPRRGSRSGRR